MLPVNLLVGLVLVWLSCASGAAEWWNQAIIYQVYPRSFKDSNGDGIGDLNGIASRLEHIKELGAQGLWLSPIYTSPQVDFGYDISNFTDVDPIYGDLEDFERLVARAKALGLKLLLDLVPNHSSDQHAWFNKSAQRVQPYSDYYIWRDGKKGPAGERLPPNNWLSVFGGPAWSWHPVRQQFYYHQFAPGQPDLNFRDARLRGEMERVIEFWLDRGVDGFRIDAIIHMFEDEKLRDEPRSNRPGVPPNEYEYLEHPYTKDQDETYDVVAEWRALMDRYSKAHGTGRKYAIVEAGSPIDKMMRYYAVGVEPFNFAFTAKLNNDSKPSDYVDEIRLWMDNMPRGQSANWVTGNHDTSRAGSRLGYNSSRSDQLSMLAAVLPGITVIYNGDEIGMLNRPFTYEETVDPAGCNAGPERYHLKSRDPARTPFQWDNTTSAGFSSSAKTWLPVHGNYKSLNLAAQKRAKLSHYRLFQQLAKLKKTSLLREGNLEASVSKGGNVLGLVRRLPHRSPLILLVNFVDTHGVQLDLKAWLHATGDLKVHAASVKSGLQTGRLVTESAFVLPPAASVILAGDDLA